MFCRISQNCEEVFCLYFLYRQDGHPKKGGFPIKFGTFGPFEIGGVGDKHPTTPTTLSVMCIEIKWWWWSVSVWLSGEAVSGWSVCRPGTERRSQLHRCPRGAAGRHERKANQICQRNSAEGNAATRRRVRLLRDQESILFSVRNTILYNCFSHILNCIGTKCGILSSILQFLYAVCNLFLHFNVWSEFVPYEVFKCFDAICGLGEILLQVYLQFCLGDVT